MKNINEAYEASVSSLQETLAAKRYEETVPAVKKEFIESLGSLLQSESVILSCPEAEQALVIAEDINAKIFPVLGEAVVSAYQTVLSEAMNEEEETSDEEVPSDEEESSEEDESEEDETDSEEDMDDEEKQETQEALVSFLNASQYEIKESVEAPGVIINRYNPYFYAIRESILDQITKISMSLNDAEILEAVADQYEALLLKEQGVELSEGPKEYAFAAMKHIKDIGMKAADATIGNIKRAYSGRLSKAAGKEITKQVKKSPTGRVSPNEIDKFAALGRKKRVIKDVAMGTAGAGALTAGGVVLAKNRKSKEDAKQIEKK